MSDANKYSTTNQVIYLEDLVMIIIMQNLHIPSSVLFIVLSK